MKKNFLIFIAFMLLSSLAFGQEFQPVVFSEQDFFVSKNDMKMHEVGERVAWLPRNLPRIVKEGNQWWKPGEKYIPHGWPIPSHDLGIKGSWFGWYLHRADSALYKQPEEQIRALDLPESVKNIFVNQVKKDGSRTLLSPRTLTNAMVYVLRGEIRVE
ncbi:MAG TPA: hypothetical protein PKZ16_03005, partial [bacterium]|nr:hypothetical protein [bacterium]